MNLTELRWALDKYADTDHNDDELVLIQQPGENYSIGILHRDGQARPYEEIIGSHFNFTFNYTEPSRKD